MAKKTEKAITTKVENRVEVEVQENANENRVSFAPVDELEKAAKVGFYCEARPADDTMLEPLLRLRCESKDPDKEAAVLTPWCTSQTLGAMIQGCLYLNPLILRCIKENQSNAPAPEGE